MISKNTVKCHNIKVLYTTGMFAKCKLLQNSMKKAFHPQYEIVISSYPEIDTITGAVFLVADPKITFERLSKITYGIKATKFFDTEKHPRYKYTAAGGSVHHELSLMVQENTHITPLNNKFEKKVPLFHLQTNIIEYIYEAKNPKSVLYTDSPGVKKVGRIVCSFPPAKYGDELILTFNFSETEMFVIVQDSKSGKCLINTAVDFFNE